MRIHREYTAKISQPVCLALIAGLLSACTGTSSVNGAGFGGGNTLESSRTQLVAAVQLITQNVDTDSLCTHATFTATAAQQSTCLDFITKTAAQIVQANADPTNIPLDLTDQTMQIGIYLADSWTTYAATGAIYVNQMLLSAPALTLLTRLGHEFGHKVLYQGSYLTDLQTIASLSGYRFLDWVGLELATYTLAHNQAPGSLDNLFNPQAMGDAGGMLVGPSTSWTGVDPNWQSYCGLALSPDGSELAADWLEPNAANFVISAAYLRLQWDGTLISPTFPESLSPPGSNTNPTLSLDFDAQGDLLFGGDTSIAGHNWQPFMERLLPSGSLDTSFASQGVLVDTNSPDSVFMKIKVLPDGRIVAAGFGFVRVYLADGTPDPSFTPFYGASTTLAPSSINYQLDPNTGALTRILISGSTWDTVNEAFIWGLLPNGQLDAQFGSQGIYSVPDQTIRSTLILPDGNLLLAGNCFTGSSHQCLSRLTPNGQLDTKFGTEGWVLPRYGDADTTNDEAYALGLQPGLNDPTDYRLILVGKIGPAVGPVQMTIAKLKPDGSFDQGNFGTNGFLDDFFPGDTWDQPCNVLVDRGKILVALFRTVNGSTNFTLMRLNNY